MRTSSHKAISHNIPESLNEKNVTAIHEIHSPVTDSPNFINSGSPFTTFHEGLTL